MEKQAGLWGFWGRRRKAGQAIAKRFGHGRPLYILPPSDWLGNANEAEVLVQKVQEGTLSWKPEVGCVSASLLLTFHLKGALMKAQKPSLNLTYFRVNVVTLC